MSSSIFFTICLLHSLASLTSGLLMIFYLNEISIFCHGIDTSTKILGSTPHDQLLIQTSDSFAGLLLCVIGVFLFMVSFVKDREFQGFFAKGCVLVHVSVAVWRFYFERRVEDLAKDWPRQVVGDILLGISWVFFLVYSWREKYDWWWDSDTGVVKFVVFLYCKFYEICRYFNTTITSIKSLFTRSFVVTLWNGVMYGIVLGSLCPARTWWNSMWNQFTYGSFCLSLESFIEIFGWYASDIAPLQQWWSQRGFDRWPVLSLILETSVLYL